MVSKVCISKAKVHKNIEDARNHLVAPLHLTL